MLVRNMGGVTKVMQSESFLEWLTRLKNERGVSWRKLAEESGVSHGSLDNYRRKPGTIPELPTLMKLAVWAGESLEDVQRRLNIQPSTQPRTPNMLRQRADRIIFQKPSLRPFLNTMLRTPDVDPALVSSILDYLEKKYGIGDKS